MKPQLATTERARNKQPQQPLEIMAAIMPRGRVDGMAVSV
jgi:hypothetical protein